MFQAHIFPIYLVLSGLLAFGPISWQNLPAQERASNEVPHSTHRIDEKLEGPESAYTGYILDLIRKWPTADFSKAPKKEGNPVQLECIETPGNPFYIGIKQQMIVNASLEQVEAVLDDMNHYKDLFPGYDDVHIVSKDSNRILTFWEQHIPIFFVPNVVYQLFYLVDKSSNNRRIYRYQLKESSTLKTNDGVILLERDSSRTRYYEYDFCDADWGIVKSVAPHRIWKESVEGVYLSDVAIKFRAEHPDWSYKRIAEESRKVLEAFPVEKAIEHKTDAKALGVRFQKYQ